MARIVFTSRYAHLHSHTFAESYGYFIFKKEKSKIEESEAHFVHRDFFFAMDVLVALACFDVTARQIVRGMACTVQTAASRAC